MRTPWLTGLLILCGTALAAFSLWWAPLNQDEGWYLIAAQRVAQGRMPYRDFAYTQAPLFPYLSQGAVPMVRQWGLLGGRAHSLGWSLLSLATLLTFLFRRCAKAKRSTAMLCGAALLALNPFFLQYSVTVKTYSLTGFLLLLAGIVWIQCYDRPQSRLFALCPLLLSLAAGIRLSSLGFFLPLAADSLLRRSGDRTHRVLLFCLFSGLGLGLVFAPFLLAAPEQSWFGMISFHAAREVENAAELRVGFISRSLQAFLPSVLLLLYLLPRIRDWNPALVAPFAGVLCVSLIHFAAPFPYDEYQAILFPVLALIISLQVPEFVPAEARSAIHPVLVCGMLAFALGSPHWQSWATVEQDRLWPQFKEQSDLHRLRLAGNYLRLLSPEPPLLLTADAYLAVESGMDVPPGLEMGPFSFFPDLDRDTAKRMNVHNTESLMDLIAESRAPVAAFSGYGFSIAGPELRTVAPAVHESLLRQVRSYYSPHATLPAFGQQATDLDLYIVKSKSDP